MKTEKRRATKSNPKKRQRKKTKIQFNRMSNGKRKEAALEEWTHNASVSYKFPLDYIESKLPDGLHVIPFVDAEGSHAIITEWYFFQANARMNPAVVPRFVGYFGRAPDVHVHTYVRHEDGREGLFCFKIWMGNSMACWIGRRFYYAPMYAGDQSLKEENGIIEHTCTLTDSKAKVTERTVFRYKPVGEARLSEEGSLDQFTIDKYTDRQFTYFKDKLNSIPSILTPAPRPIQELEIVEYSSNLLEHLFTDHPTPPYPSRVVCWANTLCSVGESE